MHENFSRYLEVKKKIKELEDEKLVLEVAFYNIHIEKLKQVDEGTVKFDHDGFRLKVVKKLTWTLDQNKAEDCKEIARVKYELDKIKYNNLSDQDKMKYADFITVKPAKPSFEVEAL